MLGVGGLFLIATFLAVFSFKAQTPSVPLRFPVSVRYRLNLNHCFLLAVLAVLVRFYFFSQNPKNKKRTREFSPEFNRKRFQPGRKLVLRITANRSMASEPPTLVVLITESDQSPFDRSYNESNKLNTADLPPYNPPSYPASLTFSCGRFQRKSINFD